MLRWALGFLMVALVGAMVGFGGFAVEFAPWGQAAFAVGLSLFVMSLLTITVGAAGSVQQPDDELSTNEEHNHELGSNRR